MSIDIASYFSNVDRRVTSTEREGKQMRVLTVSKVYPADAKTVWNSLSSAERISKWFLPVSGELRKGGQFQFEGNAGGTILECEPESKVDLTWEFGGMVSWVTITLKQAEEGTKFTLQHSAEVDDERWNTYGPGAVGMGWESGLYGLQKYLHTGLPNILEESFAWIQSPDGRSFMTQTSDGWRQANIDSGTDEMTATESAARCLAAYLGEA